MRSVGFKHCYTTDTILHQSFISPQYSSIWPIHRTLLGATSPGQSGARSSGTEEVLRIPQSSSITGILPSDCLVSYLGHSLGKCYPSAEMQLVYSTALVDSEQKLAVQIMESPIRFHILSQKVCSHFAVIHLRKAWIHSYLIEVNTSFKLVHAIPFEENVRVGTAPCKYFDVTRCNMLVYLGRRWALPSNVSIALRVSMENSREFMQVSCAFKKIFLSSEIHDITVKIQSICFSLPTTL